MRYLNPLARKSARRKDTFDSREEAREYWIMRTFFQQFHPQCFDDYLQYGLVEEEGKFRLRIPRSQETQIFCTPPAILGNTRLEMPAHYVYATGLGHVLLPEERKSHEKTFPSFEFHAWDGNHMFPMEEPEKLAEWVKKVAYPKKGMSG